MGLGIVGRFYVCDSRAAGGKCASKNLSYPAQPQSLVGMATSGVHRVCHGDERPAEPMDF